MLFNDDILYRTGALAIVWLCGNEFTNKNKRREIQRILNINVIQVCSDVRRLLPKMGMADGIPMSKMGILATGATKIFCLKVEHLRKDILNFKVSLTKPIVHDANINVPREKKQRKIKTKNVEVEGEGQTIGNHIELPANADETAFGELLQHYGALVEGEFGSPRALPAPRDYFELSGTIPPFRMEATAIEDPMANCLIENTPLRGLEQEVRFDVEDDPFGDGMVLLQQGSDDDIGMAINPTRDGMEPAPEIAEEQLGSPGVPPPPPSTSVASALGPPSSLQVDTRSKVMETPAVGTRQENLRKRRHINQIDSEDERMELGDIPPDARTTRQPKKVRRHLRLQVDGETNITLQEILERIEQVTDGQNSQSLIEQVGQIRAPPKSLWKMIPKSKNAMDLIISSGRRVPSMALFEMRSKIMEKQLRRPERSELLTASNASIEEQRDRSAQTTTGGISGPSLLPSGIAQGQVTVIPEMNFEPIYEPAEQVAIEQVHEGNDEPMPIPVGHSDDSDNPMVPQVEEHETFSPPAQRTRKSAVDEGISLYYKEGENRFFELYPPRRANRRRVAQAFSAWLALQAKNQGRLHQAEPFAEITLTSFVK